MSKDLIAMGLGSATTGDSAPPPVAQAADSGSTTIIIVALVAVVAIGLMVYLMSRANVRWLPSCTTEV